MTTILHKRPENFAETEIDAEVVLMDMASGDFFSITDTGLAIWTLIDGTRGRAALLVELAGRYGLPETAIAADVDAFLSQVTAAGFVAAD